MSGLKDFVRASKHRQRVLVALGEGFRRNIDISEESGLSRGSTSRALKQLEERGLVRCTTPGRKMDKIYELTEKGEQISEEFSNQGASPGRELEMRIGGFLDGAQIPYRRNLGLEGERFSLRPDFVIEKSGQKLLVEAKMASGKPGLERVKGAAFGFRDLKEVGEDIKTVLIIGGSSREGELGQEAVKLEDPEYFDRVFFEDELEEFIHYVEDELEDKDQSATRPKG